MPEVFFQWQPAYDHVLPWHLTLKKNVPKKHRNFWEIVWPDGLRERALQQQVMELDEYGREEYLYRPSERQGISFPVLWDSLSFIQAYIRRHRFLERRLQKAVPFYRWYGGRYVSARWLKKHPAVAKWYFSLKGNGKLTDEDVAAFGDIHDEEAMMKISKIGTELFKDIAEKVGDRIAMMTVPEFIARIYQSAYTGLFPPIMHAMLGRHADYVMARIRERGRDSAAGQ